MAPDTSPLTKGKLRVLQGVEGYLNLQERIIGRTSLTPQSRRLPSSFKLKIEKPDGSIEIIEAVSMEIITDTSGIPDELLSKEFNDVMNQED